ncbi:hypothetical protein OAB47_01335 [Vicingaceae bacterium]|jgi:hypothetical protein|nr:hypothetical protein [Vicingaceae bacterium]
MKYLGIIVLFFSSLGIFAQADEEMYSIGFEFNPGIYKSFYEFKTNNPSYSEGLQMRGEDLFIYNDSLKKYLLLNPEAVWGYSTGSGVYISAEGDFSRLNMIGSYSQFSAYVIVQTFAYDPYGFQIPRETRTLVQLLLNFDNGKVFEFNQKNVELLLQKDPQLWNEYQKFRGRKQEKQFIFLRKYNERYPIYFPVY